MRGCRRQIFAVLALVCFVAVASGLALFPHLAHLEEPGEHDTDHCPLCQLVFVSAKNCMTEPEPVVIKDELAEHVVGADPTTPSQQTRPNRFDPRAPPA